MAEFHLPPQWFYIYLHYILKIYILVFIDFIVCVFCLHALLCITYMPSALQKQKGESNPLSGVMDGCELQCGCWELNRGPLP